jgi:hypothetical protein
LSRDLYCGRRPKHDDFEDINPLGKGAEDELEDYDEEEFVDDDEEVDFDTPTFRRDQIWNDYAEDLDFDE